MGWFEGTEDCDGNPLLSQDERKIVDWLWSEYRSSGELPTNARHMLSVVARCIEAGDHRKVQP